jgi:two-component system chemotaxis response regulator CheB
VKTIRVAIADDSSFIRRVVTRMLEAEDDMRIVGAAAAGEQLLEHLDAWAPDAVILDLSMPGLGGMATLDALMARRPTPVIILSTHSGRGAPLTLEALHRGAVDFVDKQSVSLVDFEALRGALCEKIRQVTRESSRTLDAGPGAAPAGLPSPGLADAVEILVLGASTGGPQALETILRDLGSHLPVPAVIAQHMPARFTRAFAERLDGCLPLRVREAADGETLLPAAVYIAPGGQHLRIERHGARLQAALEGLRPDLQSSPSVDLLFSTAGAAAGSRTLAVLLTGMGRDGAAGMAQLSQAGAYTIAQDRATSIVYGMPKAAADAGAVREELPLGRIGPRLRALLGGG